MPTRQTLDFNNMSHAAFENGAGILTWWETLDTDVQLEVIPHLIRNMVHSLCGAPVSPEGARQVAESLKEEADNMSRYAGSLTARHRPFQPRPEDFD